MKKLALVAAFLVIVCQAFSQKEKVRTAFNLDTTYVKTYYNDLIIRVYSANKNNFIQFRDLNEAVRLKYRPNDFFNLGFGFNYKWFGLNIGTKIPAFSADDDRYGKTTNFGLQSYIYARKFTLDIMAIRTKGYYLSSDEDNQDSYYMRRDLTTNNYGVNMNYVLNNKRFSYKAAFKQNEIQLKSAGSFILGGGFYVLTVDADSAFVPRGMDEIYYTGWRELNNFQSYTLNSNFGYAYSWVPMRNWIVTGSYRLSLGLQHNIWRFMDDSTDSRLNLSRSSVIRFSTGHHFSKFYLGASFIRYQQNSTMKIHSLSILNGTNFTEFTLSKRIKL